MKIEAMMTKIKVYSPDALM